MGNDGSRAGLATQTLTSLGTDFQGLRTHHGPFYVLAEVELVHLPGPGSPRWELLCWATRSLAGDRHRVLHVPVRQ